MTPRWQKFKTMKDFWDRIPAWLLNAGWIGQSLALAASKMMHFIKEDGYALALFVGAWISLWGAWRKNKLQIRREEIALKHEQQKLELDELIAKEIHEIRKNRESKN